MTPLLVFFPDYRARTPYQSLLAAAMAPQVESRGGTIGDALDALATGRPVFFHLHFEEAIYREASTESAANALVFAFLAECEALRAAGGRLVWTMHNEMPHENRFPDVNRLLREALASASDVLHVHNETGARLAAALGADPARVLLEPHFGTYTAYPDDIDAAAARRYLDLPGTATVFAFFGTLRGYKGLDHLLSTFDVLHRSRPETALILAGSSRADAAERYLAPRPGLRLMPRFLPDAEVQYVMRAADFVVLPYTRILTSGALVLACGFGRPVVTPAHPGLLDMLMGEDAAVLYPPDAPGGLAEALGYAAALPLGRRAAMGLAALKVGRIPPARLAAALLSRLLPTTGAAPGLAAGPAVIHRAANHSEIIRRRA